LHGLDCAYERFATILSEARYSIGIIAGDLMTYPSAQELKLAEQELSRIDKLDNARRPLSEVVECALRLKEQAYKNILRRSKKPVLLLMGNDDGILGDGTAWKSDGNVIFINQTKAKYGKFNFVGYQFTTPFVGGSFERTESQQTIDLSALQESIDANTILITHGPPRGILDKARDGKHVGSKALASMLRTRPLWLHLFGHIHGNFGQQRHSINGSYPHERKFVAIDVESRQSESIS
jgi:Icc-related predicted phosphoesterase